MWLWLHKTKPQGRDENKRRTPSRLQHLPRASITGTDSYNLYCIEARECVKWTALVRIVFRQSSQLAPRAVSPLVLSILLCNFSSFPAIPFLLHPPMIRTIRPLLFAFPLFASLNTFSLSDGPLDNREDAVRPIPPPGQPLPEEVDVRSKPKWVVRESMSADRVDPVSLSQRRCPRRWWKRHTGYRAGRSYDDRGPTVLQAS